jgi:hypothetical protein
VPNIGILDSKIGSVDFIKEGSNLAIAKAHTITTNNKNENSSASKSLEPFISWQSLAKYPTKRMKIKQCTKPFHTI